MGIIKFIDRRPDLMAGVAIMGIIAGFMVADDYQQPAEGILIIFASVIALFVAAFAYNRRGKS